MKYYIDRTNKNPAYLQLYEQLRSDVVKGVFLFNDKLPSKRLLAEETGVSVITVEHTYALLCDEGYLESRERRGYYVIFRPGDEFDVSSEPQRIVHSTPHYAGGPSGFPFSVFAKTVRRVLSETGEGVFERSPNPGRLELRDALMKYLARNYGVEVEVDQIIVGAGIEYFYRMIAELLGRHKRYAIESPSYNKIEQAYAASEVCYYSLPLEKDGIESAALWSCDADVLHVSPYRSFPSGVTATASKRHEYLRWASVNDRFVVEDNFESEFSLASNNQETLFSITDNENVVYLNTFSKTISPALRVGYMVLPRRLVSPFERKLGFYSCPVSTLTQYVLAELITCGDYERHINRVRRRKRKGLL